MSCNLIVLDLDETLLGSDGLASPRTVSTLARLKKEGYYICFATGRRDTDMRPLKDITYYADYLILNNGGKIVRVRNNDVMSNRLLNPHSVELIARWALRANTCLYVLGDNYWGVNKMTPGVITYSKYLGVWPALYVNVDKLPIDAVQGLTFTENIGKTELYLKSLTLPIETTVSGIDCLDIMTTGVSKWNGIETVVRDMREKPRTITVGNYFNDMEMIKRADVGIAVKNAPQKVKSIADYVTKKGFDEDMLTEIGDMLLGGQL